MTLKECYDALGGNYEDTVRRLYNEKLVEKFLFKFEEDPSFENLKKALEIANQVTIEHGAVYVGSEHVIYGFLSLPSCSAYGILAGEGITKSEYQEVFFRCIDKIGRAHV